MVLLGGGEYNTSTNMGQCDMTEGNFSFVIGTKLLIIVGQQGVQRTRCQGRECGGYILGNAFGVLFADRRGGGGFSRNNGSIISLANHSNSRIDIMNI